MLRKSDSHPRVTALVPSLPRRLGALRHARGSEAFTLEKGAERTLTVTQGQAVVFVTSGLVMTLSHCAGRRQVLGFHWPEAIVIVPSEPEATPLCVTAIERSDLLQVPRAQLDEVVKDDATLAKALSDQALENLIKGQRAYHRMLSVSAEARVAAFFFEQAPWISSGGGMASRFDVPMRRADIADHIGVRSETLCRVLADWRQRGLIKTEGPRHFTMTDPKALRRIAGSLPQEPATARGGGEARNKTCQRAKF